MRFLYPDFWCLLMKGQIPSTGSVQCGKGKRQIAITEKDHMNIGRSKLECKTDAVPHFRTITPDGVPTKAATWLERLSSLEDYEFRHAWNQMISEALTVEYEDWRRCDVVTFNDSSAVMWSRESSPFTIRREILDSVVHPVRALNGWRLAGTELLVNEDDPSRPIAAWFISAESAAKRLGITLKKLHKLANRGWLVRLGERDSPDARFYENQVDYYRRLHPNS
jgi:hypothetical protein